jgi:hypothetical protein
MAMVPAILPRPSALLAPLRRLAGAGLPVALALGLGPIAATAAAQGPYGVTMQLNYDGSVLPSDPAYVDTLANLFYPPKEGPASQGFPVEPLPVMITIRGGNTNTIAPGLLQPDEMTPVAVGAGFIAVSFNFPTVGPGEDYNASVAGAALLIQYLRANAAALNVAPDRIIAQSRSFGTVVGYAVALREDHQDLGSPDPVLQQSSRMDYYAPRFGPSGLSCFSSDAGPWASTLNTFFFPGMTFLEATPQMRLQESAWWWLQNPELFGRQRTPPLCVVYTTVHNDVCGQVTDVHSGIFGDMLIESIEDFARSTGDYAYAARCGSVDTSQQPDPSVGIVVWAMQRLADDFDGLWLVPPIGAAGGNVTLRTFGGTPNNDVLFFTGLTAGTFPLLGCPQLQGQIVDFVQLGADQVNAAGIAEFSFPVAGSASGQRVLFHAVDLGGCEMSNVQVHTW